MTQKLTERLQERLSQQTAEIESLTVNELRQLAKRLQNESDHVLRTTNANIHAATEEMNESLSWLLRFSRWWWGALIGTWVLMIGLSAWHSMTSQPAGIGMYQSFTHQGRTYLLLPHGTEALSCTDSTSGAALTCMLLPEGR